jgi:hypothetical protein
VIFPSTLSQASWDPYFGYGRVNALRMLHQWSKRDPA